MSLSLSYIIHTYTVCTHTMYTNSTPMHTYNAQVHTYNTHIQKLYAHIQCAHAHKQYTHQMHTLFAYNTHVQTDRMLCGNTCCVCVRLCACVRVYVSESAPVSVLSFSLSPKQCKTSFVGQSAGLSVPRSPVRFRQKLRKSRT